ncbi:fused MFS/spermidine synthase [Syntrophotalea carbinolica]|uniref:fused MFS/spermidine synthase n=1 Tax=Syntrophotalea carbinolica TaxID=19 RepID=UPI0011D1597A|nr:fused MFS/spermidine synthase [Syntrophotalea carbinolica]
MASLFCHGELAASRPHPRHLTGFYLWMSVGGVLGGVFNTLLAPVLFDRVIEYPLGLLLACLLLPQVTIDKSRIKARIGDIIGPVLLAALVIGLSRFTESLARNNYHPVFFLLFAITGLACFSFKERRWRFALAFGVLLLTMAHMADLVRGNQVYASRNFFGVKRVVANGNTGIRYLYHGTTVHGSQWLASDRRVTPLTYYHPSGPVGDIFVDSDPATDKSHVAIIGLGVGALASYAHPGEHFTFYEIDPEVERIARNKRFFGFLAGTQGSLEVVLGDGRLSLARAKPGGFNIILLDAFSSDAIPVHLITREAVALYLSKLQTQGLLVFHISNRYLNLEPLMAGLAEEFGLRCIIRRDSGNSRDPNQAGKLPSIYAAMGRPGSAIRHLADNPQWQPIGPDTQPIVWTDRFSNLILLMKW